MITLGIAELIFIGLNLLDIIFTVVGLRLGAVEGNLLLVALNVTQSVGVMFVYKFMIVSGVVIVVRAVTMLARDFQTEFKRTVIKLYGFVSGILFGIVIRNFVVVWGLLEEISL